MAKQTTHDVANAVSNIIAAFYSLRDTVAKVRSSRHGQSRGDEDSGNSRHRRHRDTRSTPLQGSKSASTRLDSSIANGPCKIQHEYAIGIINHGDRFQAGDDVALASLAATLVKLNTGLVNIIGESQKICIKGDECVCVQFLCCRCFELLNDAWKACKRAGQETPLSILIKTNDSSSSEALVGTSYCRRRRARSPPCVDCIACSCEVGVLTLKAQAPF